MHHRSTALLFPSTFHVTRRLGSFHEHCELQWWECAQDVLHGRSNLELDQELQRLQDTADIVTLKFSSSSSDSVVLLHSEFQEVGSTGHRCASSRECLRH